MNLKIYRQSYKTRESGVTIYKGEDAFPISEDGLILVADGLGGKASIRHKELSKDLFEEDLIVETLFKGIYNEYDDELFVAYVKSSFADLFDIKDCYFENIYNIKKSGYFGSRIVAAIVLHEFLYNESLDFSSFFEALNSAKDETEKKGLEKNIGEKFAKVIKENLIKAAKNAGLKNESSYEGMALLGTTLNAILLSEKEDIVDLFYLTAGDSRTYVWASEGLMQITKDQEGDDGGMTNSISANEDFHIECGSIKVKKPCMIFGASDGCFDSKNFHSPLCFEKLLLDSINESESMDKAEAYLEKSFVEIGTHDDSSTLALQTFGYEDFKTLKNEVKNRLEDIQKEYIDKQPDILATDYIRESEIKLEDFKNKLSHIKNKFFEEPFVKDYCGRYLKENQIQFYIDRMDKINKQADILSKEAENEKSFIKTIIMRNYNKFKNYNDRVDQNEESGNSSLPHEETIKELKSEFDDRLTISKEQFDDSLKKVHDIFATIHEIGTPRSTDDYDELEESLIKDCENQMVNLIKFFKSIKNGKDKSIKKIISERHLWEQKNIKKAKRSAASVEEFYNSLVEGDINIEELKLFGTERKAIKKSTKVLSEKSWEIERLNTIEANKALEESIQLLWNQEYVKIIQEIVLLPEHSIHKDLHEEAKLIVGDYQESMKLLEENCLLQSSLFEKYNSTYLRYINGEAK